MMLFLLLSASSAWAQKAPKTGLSPKKLLNAYKRSFSEYNPRILGLEGQRATTRKALQQLKTETDKGLITSIDAAGGNVEKAIEAVTKERTEAANKQFNDRFSKSKGRWFSSGPSGADKQEHEQRLGRLKDVVKFEMEPSEKALKEATDVRSAAAQVAGRWVERWGAGRNGSQGVKAVLEAVGRRLEKTKDPMDRMRRVESVLHAKINDQIAAGRPVFLEHLRTASPQTLVTEIAQLSHTIGRETGGSALRKEVIAEAEGSSNSVTGPLALHGEKVGIFGQVKAEIDAAGGAGHSESSFSIKKYEILKDAQAFNVVVGDPVLQAVPPKGTKLPVEARLILEKALKLSETVTALATRFPGEAEGLERWARQSTITVNLPVRTRSYGPIEYEPKVISLLGVHDAMKTLVDSRIVDAGRVRSLDQVSTDSLVNDL
jgi:hypothetical protein